jgi:hypothetical protein
VLRFAYCNFCYNGNRALRLIIEDKF